MTSRATHQTKATCGAAPNAGDPDPHVGLAVCDTCDVLAEETDVETARAVAEHIVQLHNANLQAP